MFHKEFYRLFDNTNYILIYQLDCWVFYDDLDKWLDESFESVVSLFEMPDLNEYYIWSVLIPKVFVDFKVCPPDDALNFSMEMHPRLLYEMNNCRLPMGVHAWEKYDWEFWRNFIKY